VEKFIYSHADRIMVLEGFKVPPASIVCAVWAGKQMYIKPNDDFKGDEWLKISSIIPQKVGLNRKFVVEGEFVQLKFPKN